MINSYNPNPIIIHSGLLKKKKSYSLFIWGEQKKHKKYVDIEPFKYPFLYSPFELKLALFRQHETSFYGTFLEVNECQIQVPLNNRMFFSLAGNVPVYHVPSTYEHHIFPINGIEIPIENLHLYLSTLLQLHNTNEWQIADDMLFFVRFINSMLDHLTSGKVLPTSQGNWEIVNFPFQRWQDMAPESLFALLPVHFSFLDKKTEKPSLLEFGSYFINEYVTFLVKNDRDTNQAFHLLKTDQPTEVKKMLNELQHDQASSYTSEGFQYILESIGAIEVAPFKLGLRIEEGPNDTDLWLLTLFIQDRQDPTVMIDVSDLLSGDHPWRDNPITFFKEALQKGKNHIETFQFFSLSNPSIEVSIEQAYDFLTENEEELQLLGITVLVPSWWNKKETDFTVLLKQSDYQDNRVGSEPLLNWQAIASFDYSISIGGMTISEAEFHELVNDKRPIVKLKGKWIVWDVKTAEKIQEKIHLYKEKKKLTYMQAYQLQLQNDVENNILWETKWNNKLKLLLNDLTLHSWTKAPLPKRLKGSLRPYQHDGFSWLLNMRKIGFGACLADDMGLGKTIQTISYILSVIETKQDRKKEPFLLICPTSLIGNWEYELEAFAPSLHVAVHHGQNRSIETSLENADIIITSYALAVRDEVLLTTKTWEGLILDEAQHIKNVETKQRRSIKQLQAVHRIALTGTPIENRLKELWSIIDLLNDHFLGSYQQFSKVYCKEIESGDQENNNKLNELRSLISPFLLRRTKQDKSIHLQLPSKNEMIHRVGLTVEQASLYQAVIHDLFDRIDHVSVMERRALILSSLTKLKQICNHPAHYLKDGGHLENRSEKWEEMMILAETIATNQEKALIFSQYKEMGTIIQKGLEEKFNKDIPFLHGSLQRHKREQLISQFMNGDVPFFILSLKAGGVGLNLTQATHVIHYDRWWNPAVENQATDRAYRIGQTEVVTVHKLLTKGTLEEKIHLMLEKKQALSNQLLNTNENKISELSTNDLEQFLKLRVSNLT